MVQLSNKSTSHCRHIFIQKAKQIFITISYDFERIDPFRNSKWNKSQLLWSFKHCSNINTTILISNTKINEAFNFFLKILIDRIIPRPIRPAATSEAGCIERATGTKNLSPRWRVPSSTNLSNDSNGYPVIRARLIEPQWWVCYEGIINKYFWSLFVREATLHRPDMMRVSWSGMRRPR